MPLRGDAALTLALALTACDSSIKLEVVSAVSSRPGANAGSPGTSTGGVGGSAAGGHAGRVDSHAGGGVGGTGEGGDGADSAYPWEAEALYVASFASFAFPGEYLREQDIEAWVSVIDPLTEADEANFEVTPGLIDPECISLRQPGGQGSFLRHSNGRLYFHLATDIPLFLGDSTFCVEPGLAEPTWVSLRSYNYPKTFVYVREGRELYIGQDDGSPEFAGAATFRVENPFEP